MHFSEFQPLEFSSLRTFIMMLVNTITTYLLGGSVSLWPLESEFYLLIFLTRDPCPECACRFHMLTATVTVLNYILVNFSCCKKNDRFCDLSEKKILILKHSLHFDCILKIYFLMITHVSARPLICWLLYIIRVFL